MSFKNTCKKCKAEVPISENKCPACGTRVIPIYVYILFAILGIFLFGTIFSGGDNTSTKVEKEYRYAFVKENKQLTGSCTRSEWVYSTPDSIISDDIEPILQKIYDERKKFTDRTNISLYTETALSNIDSGKADVSIGFLNDGFNCDTPRDVEMKNSWDLYNMTKNL